MKKFLFTVLCLFVLFSANAQSFLRITKHHVFKNKTYELFNNEIIEYRLKGERKFRKDRMVHLRDSLILFENDKEIQLSQIKALRLRSSNFLVSQFRQFFIRGGIIFFTLNSLNNVIIETHPVVSETSVYITLGMIGTGLVIREILIKRIRVNSRVTLRIIDVDFQNMNKPDTGK